MAMEYSKKALMKMSIDDEDVEANVNLRFVDNDHQTGLLKALNMMRKNRHFCDVILQVGNAEIFAHRCVLASASPYLLELFTKDHDNGIMRKFDCSLTYKLPASVDKNAIQVLVDYAYTSAIDIPETQVNSVYIAARLLKIDRVINECITFMISTLDMNNCIEIRSLPGISKNKSFVAKVDKFISQNFHQLTKNVTLLSLNCVQIEILSQTRQEMNTADPQTLCHLALEWIKRHVENVEDITYASLLEKTHMLYLALDNTLQDCTDLPSEDVSNTDIVRDYKKISSKIHGQNNAIGGGALNGNAGVKEKSTKRKKCLGQPSKPRVLVYPRDINGQDDDECAAVEQEYDRNWNLIAMTTVRDHTFLAIAIVDGKLTSMSIQLRLNPPNELQIPSAPLSAGLKNSPEHNGVQFASVCSKDSTTNSAMSGSCSSSINGASAESLNEDDEQLDLYCALSPMTSGRSALGCVDYNGTLIVVGGYDRVECLRLVERYTPATNMWEKLPDMRESRGRLHVAIVGDNLFALGGSNGHTELSSVEKLNMTAETFKWEPYSRMPMAKSNLGVCSIDDTIYCIGGWNGQAGIKQCDKLNTASKEWLPIAPLNTGRHQAGVAVYQNHIYVCGGTDNWNCLSSVEVYDALENYWTFAAPLNSPRRGCAAVVYKHRLYVIGGSDGTHSLNTTEVYDFNARTWSIGPNMTTARANVGCAVVGSRLYAVGGFSGKAFLNTIEYLDETTNEWTVFIPRTKQLDDVLSCILTKTKTADVIVKDAFNNGDCRLASKALDEVGCDTLTEFRECIGNGNGA